MPDARTSSILCRAYRAVHGMEPDSAHAGAYLAPSSAASHVTTPGPVPSITGACDHQYPAHSTPRPTTGSAISIVARATLGPNTTSVRADAADANAKTGALCVPRACTHVLLPSHTTAISAAPAPTTTAAVLRVPETTTTALDSRSILNDDATSGVRTSSTVAAPGPSRSTRTTNVVYAGKSRTANPRSAIRSTRAFAQNEPRV
jgi:hypothetical protein